MRIGLCGFGRDEVVLEVCVWLVPVEHHRVDIAVVFRIESDESSSLSDVIDAAGLCGLGE